MNPQLEKRLFTDFPKLFRIHYFECGDGWYDLIHRLSAHIASEVDKLPEEEQKECYVVQVKVKEKFGTLRYYMFNATEEMHAAILLAENDSFGICEECGETSTAKRRQGGWIVTQCDECWIETLEKRLERAEND